VQAEFGGQVVSVAVVHTVVYDLLAQTVTVATLVSEPEVDGPEAVKPEDVTPETLAPAEVEPEMVAPEEVRPEAAEPEVVVVPGEAEPAVVEPAVVEPEVDELEAIGPETLYTALVPGLFTVPVTALKNSHSVPSVDTATHSAYRLHSAMHDWIVYGLTGRWLMGV
jgi:hypothetical protein